MRVEHYDPPSAITALTSWLLGRTARKAQEIVESALAREGFRRPHFAALAAVAEFGPMSQADLGRRLWMDRSDIHAVMVELEDRRLIKRRGDPGDKRRNLVAITDRGVRVLDQLNRQVLTAQEDLLLPLTVRHETSWSSC